MIISANTNNAGAGYYDVSIIRNAEVFTYRVFAISDYAAAVKVREQTGCMPRSQHDVEFIQGAQQRKQVNG